MADIIKLRQADKQAWQATSLILQDRELGLVLDDGKIQIILGDGVSLYANLYKYDLSKITDPEVVAAVTRHLGSNIWSRNENQLEVNPAPYAKPLVETFAITLQNAIKNLNTRNYGGREVTIIANTGTHNISDNVFDLTGIYNGRLIIEAAEAIPFRSRNQKTIFNFNGQGGFKALNCYLNIDIRMIRFNVVAGHNMVMFNVDGNTNVTTYRCCWDLSQADEEATAFFLAGVRLTSCEDTFIGSPTQITNFVKLARGGNNAYGGQIQIFNGVHEITKLSNGVNGKGVAAFGDSDNAFINKVVNGAIDISRDTVQTALQQMAGFDAAIGTFWRDGGSTIPKLFSTTLSVISMTSTSILVQWQDVNNNVDEASNLIEWGLTSSGIYTGNASIPKNVISYNITGLTLGTNYNIRHRFIGDGVTTIASDYSPVITFLIPGLDNLPITNWVNLNGVIRSNDTLTGIYSYSDIDGDLENITVNGSQYRLKRYNSSLDASADTNDSQGTIVASGHTGGPAMPNFSYTIPLSEPGYVFNLGVRVSNSNGQSLWKRSSNSSDLVNKPSITSLPNGTINISSIVLNGEITELGGRNLTSHGFVYNLTPNTNVGNYVVQLGSRGTIGTFTSTINNLSPNTTYYVRAFGTNVMGTSYGQQLAITTNAAGAVPTLLAPVISLGTLSTSTVRININNGNVLPAARSLEVQSNASTIGTWDVVASNVNKDSTFYDASQLASTTMNYRVRAVGNGVDELNSPWSNIINATTFSISLPTIQTLTPNYNDITGVATLRCNISNLGGAATVEYGFRLDKDSNPTSVIVELHNFTQTTGIKEGTINYLDVNDFYYYRAYATNSAGTVLGDIVQLETIGSVAQAPTVMTQNPSSISYTTVTFNGNLTNNGNGTITARGFVYGASPNPTLSDTVVSSGGLGIGAYSANVTGLSEASTIHYRAYSTNEYSTSYGTSYVVQLLDSSISTYTVSTQAATLVTSTTVTINGTIVNNGGQDGDVGFVLGLSANPTLGNTVLPQAEGSMGAILHNLTGRTPGEVFHYRTYATNTAGTVYGADVVVTMEAAAGIQIPTVTTIAPSEITENSFMSGVVIVDNGGEDPSGSEVGFVYGLTTGQTVANPYGNGRVIGNDKTIALLTPNTTYYVRGYATNSAGTGYGNEITVQTLNDVIRPTIVNLFPWEMNSKVMIAYSEPVIHVGGGVVVASDFAINIITAGTGTPSIASISNDIDGSIIEATDKINFTLNWAGTPDGTERFVIRPVSGMVTDAVGNVSLATDVSPTIQPWIDGQNMIQNGGMYSRVGFSESDESITFDGVANIPRAGVDIKITDKELRRQLEASSTYELTFDLVAPDEAIRIEFKSDQGEVLVAANDYTTGAITIPITTLAGLLGKGFTIQILYSSAGTIDNLSLIKQ